MAVLAISNGSSRETETYSYIVTKTSKGYEDAIGDYYLATPEEMMELYPRIDSYEGGQYYTTGKG